MAVQSVQTGTPALPSIASAPALGKDAFLNLLIQQMKMQDPLEPMKNEQMIAQLAQFSSLEQLQNMSGALQQNLDVNLAIGQMLSNTMAATLLGKEVHVATDRVTLEGNGAASLGYRLQGDAHRVEIKVYDSNGTLVRTLESGATSTGVHALEWDGKDADGRTVAGGEYRFEVQATRADGSVVESAAMLVGRVSGIRYVDGGAQVLIGATAVRLGDIEEILA